MKRLEARHALLTGAGGGIGLAVAEAYLAEGATCTVADLAEQAPPAVAALSDRYPGRLLYVRTDVTDEASVRALVAAAQDRFGPIDILFNNAAVFDMAPLLESHLAMYQRLFDVNVKGMFLVMQQVLQSMVDAGRTGSV
ncbi:MAG TPA: SDR family NAD(P)-dependent oxidoreductase, partial [Telluria sp.]